MSYETVYPSIVGIAVAVAIGVGASAGERTETQQKYAESLWNFVVTQQYANWDVAPSPVDYSFGPPAKASAKSFLNSKASGTDMPYGAVVVTEHYADGGDDPLAVTVSYRARKGYLDRTHDWYWAHYTADGTVLKTVADRDPYAKRGFVTELDEDGRLWVFRTDSIELAGFLAKGELAKHVIRPAAGPNGKTLKGPDSDTILAYLAAAEGFTTFLDEGRIWAFRNNSDALAQFLANGEPAKQVIRPAAGPLGMTVKSDDSSTIEEYVASASGFITVLEDGRIWVFRDDAAEWEDFQSNGELAKHVIRPAAGPLGMTVKAPDAETIDAYLQSKGL